MWRHFFPVTYYDQITIFWYLTIGMIGALVRDETGKLPNAEPEKVPVPQLGHLAQPRMNRPPVGYCCQQTKGPT